MPTVKTLKSARVNALPNPCEPDMIYMVAVGQNEVQLWVTSETGAPRKASSQADIEAIVAATPAAPTAGVTLLQDTW